MEPHARHAGPALGGWRLQTEDKRGPRRSPGSLLQWGSLFITLIAFFPVSLGFVGRRQRAQEGLLVRQVAGKLILPQRRQAERAVLIKPLSSFLPGPVCCGSEEVKG